MSEGGIRDGVGATEPGSAAFTDIVTEAKRTETTTTLTEEAKNRNGDAEKAQRKSRELRVVRATGKQMKCTAALNLAHLMKNKKRKCTKTTFNRKMFTVKSCHSFISYILSNRVVVLCVRVVPKS